MWPCVLSSFLVSFFLPKHGAPARHCSNVMGYVDGGAECSEEDDEEEDELCPHPLLALRVALCAHCALIFFKCSSPECAHPLLALKWPCVWPFVLMCSSSLCAHVLMCSSSLCAHVLMCSSPAGLVCSCAHPPGVLMCSSSFCAHVLILLVCSCAHPPGVLMCSSSFCANVLIPCWELRELRAVTGIKADGLAANRLPLGSQQ